MPVTMPFQENGVKVHFPDANNFRLSNCPAYTAISGKGVKEMDIGWYDSANDTLWLVELKGYYHPVNLTLHKDLSVSNVMADVTDNLVAKSIHTLCQVTTDRAGTKSCMGLPVTDHTAIRLVHLIRVLTGQETYLGPLQSAIQARLKPYIAIYNVSGVVVLSYDYAVQHRSISWIV